MIPPITSMTVGIFIALQGIKCNREIHELRQTKQMHNIIRRPAICRLIAITTSCLTLGAVFMGTQALWIMKIIECVMKISCIGWNMIQNNQSNPNLRWDCLRTFSELMAMFFIKASISQKVITIHQFAALLFETIACIEMLTEVFWLKIRDQLIPIASVTLFPL